MIAAAKTLASRLDRTGRPDALPAAVAIGGKELPLEMYLYAAARVVAGQKGTFEAPPLRPVADPARWTVKPARRR